MRQRFDNTMVIVSCESAVIDFDDIVGACRIEEDYGPAPWKMMYGYDHTKERIRHSYQEDSAGYCWPHRQNPFMVVLEYDQDLYDWYRRRGASRQAARERTAASMKIRTEQLVRWYEQGWCYVAVCLEFKGQHYSLGGILDPTDQELDDYKQELAGECAAELVRQGYTVENQPANQPAAYSQRKESMTRNVTLF